MNDNNGKKGLSLLLRSSPKDLPTWVWIVALLFMPQIIPTIAGIPLLSKSTVLSVEKFESLRKETEKVVELTDNMAGTVISLDVRMINIKEQLKEIKQRLRDLEKK